MSGSALSTIPVLLTFILPTVLRNWGAIITPVKINEDQPNENKHSGLAVGRELATITCIGQRLWAVRGVGKI